MKKTVLTFGIISGVIIAVLMGINPFDQFGVELGKEIAKSIETEGAKGFDPSTMALIDLALGVA